MRVSFFKDYLHLAGKLVNIGPAGGRTKDLARKTNFGILSINLVLKFSNRSCRPNFGGGQVEITFLVRHVLPVIDYGCVVWHDCNKSLADKLERLQNQARRGILRVKTTTCTQYFNEEHSRAVNTVQ